MRRALLLFPVILVASCDNKYEKMAQQAASASASAVPVASAPIPSAVASTPPPRKKREFKCDDTTNVVDFHGDAVLEAEVRRKLSNGAAPKKGDITKMELANVKSLNLTKAGNRVDDLDPCVMPHFKGLKDLFLGEGELEDLSPIQTLGQLWSLRASGNHVKDLKPITRLVQLDRLDLSHTQVADLEPLKTLTVLTELQLDDTQVEDLTPLTGLKKLQKLHLRNTRVKNLMPLKDLKELQLLEVQGTPVVDTSMLGPLVAHGLKVKVGVGDNP
jgi:internalin A